MMVRYDAQMKEVRGNITKKYGLEVHIVISGIRGVIGYKLELCMMNRWFDFFLIGRSKIVKSHLPRLLKRLDDVGYKTQSGFFLGGGIGDTIS